MSATRRGDKEGRRKECPLKYSLTDDGLLLIKLLGALCIREEALRRVPFSLRK